MQRGQLHSISLHIQSATSGNVILQHSVDDGATWVTWATIAFTSAGLVHVLGDVTIKALRVNTTAAVNVWLIGQSR